MLTKTMKERAERCVCRYCGNPLEIRVVVFNKYGGAGAELYCGHCDKIEFGTEPVIYQTAKEYIDNMEYNYFYNLPEDQRTYEMNIAKVCEILSWSSQRWNLLNHTGMNPAIQFHDEDE